IPPDDMKLLINLFHEAHPEIKLQYIEVAATARTARMVQESNAGGPTADYLTTNPAAILTVAKRGLVRQVDWKVLGVTPSPQRTPSPFMINSHATGYITLVNTTKVSPAEAPTAYEDAIDPKWKGRIAMWQQSTGLLGMIALWGEEKTTAFVQ